ncbi:MAG: OmpA family protein [Myxococcales bacterium]|nr:OmpA family protein [Myxococcales bacterium]
MTSKLLRAHLILAASLTLLAGGGCIGPTVEDKLAAELAAHDLLAQKTDRGLVLYLPDVLFDFDRDELTQPAREKIHAVAEIIVRLAPERALSVEGHADSVGEGEYNLALSLRRARSVEIELMDGGIDPRKIAMIGFGERFPVAPNKHPDGRDNPEGRSRNRRVEVVIER